MQAEGNVVAFFNFDDETKAHSTCYHCQLMEGDYLLDQFEKERATTNESTTITETYDAKGLANLDPESTYEKYHAIIRIIFDKPHPTHTQLKYRPFLIQANTHTNRNTEKKAAPTLRTGITSGAVNTFYPSTGYTALSPATLSTKC